MSKGAYRRGKVWWITYQGPDGRQRWESSKSNLKADAEYLLACRRKDIAEGKEPLIKRIPNYTFSQLAERYLGFVKNQKSYRTKKGYVKRLIAEFGDLLLRGFTLMAVEQFQSRRLSEGKKPATVNRELATLKHMFTKATEWEMVTEDIFKKVRRVKLTPENNRRLRYLSKEECQALTNACSPHLLPIVIMALNTGMRKEEILSLEWERHIDLIHGFILLDVTKNGDRREIPINQTLREALQCLIRGISSPYVFIDEKGNRFKDVKRSFHTACRRAGIKNFRFHDLRHTFASHLIMAGVDITTVKELLGHKTLTMTLRYAHLAPSHKIKAVEMLDNSISRDRILKEPFEEGKEYMAPVQGNRPVVLHAVQ